MGIIEFYTNYCVINGKKPLPLKQHEIEFFKLVEKAKSEGKILVVNKRRTVL